MSLDSPLQARAQEQSAGTAGESIKHSRERKMHRNVMDCENKGERIKREQPETMLAR